MSAPARILFVEDSEDDVLLILRELRRGGCDPAFERVDTEAAFTAALRRQDWDFIIADYSMPQFNALEALSLLQQSGLDLPFIIVSGAIGEDVAVAAMKSGAHDYLLKSNLARLAPAMERELREAKVRRERQRARDAALRWASIVVASDDAIIGRTLDGIITSWNPGAERLFGYTAEEMRGRSTVMLVPFDRAEEEQGIVARLKQGRRVDPFETVRIRKDGKRIDVSLTISPILDANGRIVGSSKIARDITEQKRSEEALRASREQLRALAAHLQSVREEERKLIAREIHDELGQSLTGLKMDLAWIRNRLQSPDAEGTRPALLEKIGAMGSLIDGTANLIRKICTELRPGILDDLGLPAAIEWQAREFQSRTGIPCAVALETENLSLDPERSTAVFRIFQEVLTNVARHARATRVEVWAGRIEEQTVMQVS
ncbi:MAG TPA: PAS domain S-box protein, partial [Verrucomicrobiae bacterium]|nr:PAS domain S-box protein [Verrucomicrobiae bacterium]